MSDRRQLIASLLDRHAVTSQPQLVELLAGNGVQRDPGHRVARPRAARRCAGAQGRPSGVRPAGRGDARRAARAAARGARARADMEPSGNLLVLKTAPANAMPVARAFDVTELRRGGRHRGRRRRDAGVAREPHSGADVAAMCAEIQAGAIPCLSSCSSRTSPGSAACAAATLLRIDDLVVDELLARARPGRPPEGAAARADPASVPARPLAGDDLREALDPHTRVVRGGDGAAGRTRRAPGGRPRASSAAASRSRTPAPCSRATSTRS